VPECTIFRGVYHQRAPEVLTALRRASFLAHPNLFTLPRKSGLAGTLPLPARCWPDFLCPSAFARGSIRTMEVIIQPNQEAAASLVARIVARELRTNPQLVLGLAPGQTMECVY